MPAVVPAGVVPAVVPEVGPVVSAYRAAVVAGAGCVVPTEGAPVDKAAAVGG